MKHHISFDLEFKKNPYKGKIIVIEGTDGSGKTTQAHALVTKLVAKGIRAVYTKEPTDDIIGTFIREKVLSGQYAINPLALQYLFNADRIMHLEKIEKLLADGVVVVMDRYFWSAVAYAMADMDLSIGSQDKPAGKQGLPAGKQGLPAGKQGLPAGKQGLPAGRQGADWSLVAFSILSFYHQSFAPDISFLLEVSPQVALQRIQKSGKHREIYDTKEKLLQTIKAYDFLKKKFPDMFMVIDGDGKRTPEEITEEIFMKVAGSK